ncbi:MAG: peptidoglycan DD-metalloendopeptidase family protein [Tissierellia bacterium]|nr:peptidoglycan DD-metalloendopeptidase family protein [Tissierellia bacterium]
MSNHKNRSKAIALGLAMVLGISPTVIANQKLEDAKAEKAKIQSNLNSQANKIDSTRNEVNSVGRELAELDRKVTVARNELNEVNFEIEKLEAEIVKVKNELEVAKENLKEKQEIFGARMKVMYTNGSVGYLEVLLNSKDMESLLTNTEMLNAIAKQDRDLIEEIKNQIEIIKEKEKELEIKQGELESKRAIVEEKKNQLEAATAEKAAYMSNLQNNLSVYESEYDAMLRESDEIERKIVGIQNELAEKERARQERERQEYERQQEAKKQETSTKSSKKSSTRTSSSTAVKERPMAAEPSTRSNKSMTWPVPGHSRISSPFGYRIHPVLGYKKFHSGVDIPAPAGTPVVAAKDGTVITATFMNSYGNVVMIDHGDTVTVYAHNSSLKVRPGQKVSRGQVVSLCGSTGLSTGPHVHFEVRVGGKVVNPLGYI